MSRPIQNLEALAKPVMAWVILGQWEGRRPIIAYRLIKKGKHKGLYRVRLSNGRNAWAREIKEEKQSEETTTERRNVE